MIDTTLIDLVKDWTKSLTYETSFSVVCKIANHLGLSKPNDENSYRSILNYLSINYPSVYLEATRSCRDFWNIR